jgi:hypothetical protein
MYVCTYVRTYDGVSIKFPDWVDNEGNNSSSNNNNNNKNLLRGSTKGYGGKSHYTDSQNSDTSAPSGRELYHLQLLLQAVSPETFWYTLVRVCVCVWVCVCVSR